MNALFNHFGVSILKCVEFGILIDPSRYYHISIYDSLQIYNSLSDFERTQPHILFFVFF